MCDPLTVAGAALSAASIAANQSAANQVAKARDNAMSAEAERQRSLREEASTINEQSRARYDDFGKQQTAKAQSLGDFLASNTSQGAAKETPTAVGAGAGNVAVNDEIQRQMGKARAYGAQQNDALADMRSFGDTLGTIGLGQARDAGYVGQLGGFQRTSAGLLPNELEAANAKGAGARTLGDVLKLGGLVTMGAGLAGKGPAFGDLFGGGPSAGALHAAKSTSLSNAPGGFGFFSPF